MGHPCIVSPPDTLVEHPDSAAGLREARGDGAPMATAARALSNRRGQIGFERMNAITTSLLCLAFLAVACAGCARSEEDIQREFDEVVAGANECADAVECVLVFPGCPLGCFVAVNEANAAEVEQRAQELVDAYQSGGRACQYDCAAPGPITCVAGRCEVEAGP
jgi:hypothetical protein